MWSLYRRSRPTPTERSRRVGVAFALLACAGIAACTASETPPPASTAEARTVAPFPQSGDIDPGTYLVTNYTVPFEITVPEGWMTFDGANLVKDDPDHPGEWGVFLTFWPATHVPTDACAWQSALVPIDPTAEAFVAAMTAQASTVTTTPARVAVGEYSGFEFDHSVESGVDISDCDSMRLCIYAESARQCSRWYSSESEHETYRVVELNGERAVIAAGQFEQSIDPALNEEARAVFDSIVFRSGD